MLLLVDDFTYFFSTHPKPLQQINAINTAIKKRKYGAMSVG